jgi:hypothetical protein
MCVHLPFFMDGPAGAAVRDRAAGAVLADRSADASVAVLAECVLVDEAAVAALAPVRLSPRARPPARALAAMAVPTTGRKILIRSPLLFASAASGSSAAGRAGWPAAISR